TFGGGARIAGARAHADSAIGQVGHSTRPTGGARGPSGHAVFEDPAADARATRARACSCWRARSRRRTSLFLLLPRLSAVRRRRRLCCRLSDPCWFGTGGDRSTAEES